MLQKDVVKVNRKIMSGAHDAANSFLSDPGKPGVRSLGPYVTHRRLWDFTDVNLADEDSNSILADNAKRTIQGNASDVD